MTVIAEMKLISNHQFGFQIKQETVKQIHKTINKITLVLVSGKYDFTTFSDILQPFHISWRDSLLFKIYKHLPEDFHALLKSYYIERHFFIKQHVVIIDIRKIRPEIPERSALIHLYISCTLPIYKQTQISVLLYCN